MSSDILGWVTKDGSSGYKAESGRYHLYVSQSCPFAHRCVIGRKLKGLEDAISVDYVDYVLNRETGWKFSPEKEGCGSDTVNGKEYLKEIYALSHPEYSGKITVPVLFDKQTKKIVSNSSADILRMFSTVFTEFCATPEQAFLIDLYPEEKRTEIDELNTGLVLVVNGGVYRVNFGANVSQENYESAITTLFDALDEIDEILSKTRYLTGDKITEADIRLFATLIRFDPAYYTLFLCTKKPIVAYKNIWPYLRDMYQSYDIGSTVNIEQIKISYYVGFKGEGAIIPVGPDLDYTEQHGRK